MFKCKIIFILSLTAFVAAPVYCQGTSGSHQIRIISGTVVNVDAVGSVITIQTEDQKQMTFSVPDKVSITQETHDIGLMDIRGTNPVTIQYYVSSPGKYAVVSIVDNEPIASSE